jgi:hypothetical protein
MILLAPLVQFRQDYLILAPLDYQMDFITVVAPAGASVTLDGRQLGGGAVGAPNSDWVPLGQLQNRAWQTLAVEIGDGPHRLVSDQDIGVIVYGLDRDVSYGYLGGLDLERLNGRPPRR